MSIELETERLLLRDYRSDDAEVALTIYGDPEVMHFIGGVKHGTVDALGGWIERLGAMFRDYQARGLSYGVMGAFEKGTGRLVGTALFKPLPWVPPGTEERIDTDELEIGWHLARAAWGHGFATELGRALRDHAFRTTTIDVLHAVVDPRNVRSERVAERVGLRRVGVTDRFYGKTLTDFQLTREEWEAMR